MLSASFFLTFHFFYIIMYQKDVVLVTICILILFWMVYEGMMVSATSNFTLLFASTLIGTERLKQKE